MNYSIEFYSTEVEEAILALPPTLLARYFSLADRMIIFGANLGEPHTKAFGDGLFELRLKGSERMRTYEELKAIALSNPEVKAEYDRIERDEMPMLDTILTVRKEVGLSQAQVAERMGIKATDVARLESALLSGKHSLSIATLRKYAKALGKRLDVRLV